MRITRITPLGPRSQRVGILLEDGESVELALQVVLEAGLAPGSSFPPERRASLEAADVRWRAREAALSLLSHRVRSAAELRQRLTRKGFDAAVADTCVSDLLERGLLDDGAFAGAFARDRLRLQPRGPRRILQELRARGVAEETAQHAMAAALEEVGGDEATLAARVAARWKPRPGEDPRRARARLQGLLARRGFGAEAVRQAVRERMREVGLA
jgi:regulatory protein